MDQSTLTSRQQRVTAGIIGHRVERTGTQRTVLEQQGSDSHSASCDLEDRRSRSNNLNTRPVLAIAFRSIISPAAKPLQQHGRYAGMCFRRLQTETGAALVDEDSVCWPARFRGIEFSRACRARRQSPATPLAGQLERARTGCRRPRRTLSRLAPLANSFDGAAATAIVGTTLAPVSVQWLAPGIDRYRAVKFLPLAPSLPRLPAAAPLCQFQGGGADHGADNGDGTRVLDQGAAGCEINRRAGCARGAFLMTPALTIVPPELELDPGQTADGVLKLNTTAERLKTYARHRHRQ